MVSHTEDSKKKDGYMEEITKRKNVRQKKCKVGWDCFCSLTWKIQVGDQCHGRGKVVIKKRTKSWQKVNAGYPWEEGGGGGLVVPG